MPALGSRGPIRPEAIRKAAAKTVTPARKLPGVSPPMPRKSSQPTQEKLFSEPAVKGKQFKQTVGKPLPKGPVATESHRGLLGSITHAIGSTLSKDYHEITDTESGSERAQDRKEAQAFKQRFPQGIKEGIAVPAGIPGLNFIVGGAAAGKAAQAVTGKAGGKGLVPKLYNEGLETLIGGPRAAVETVEHPGQALKGIEQVVTHPTQHPLQAALIFSGAARGADRAAGGAAEAFGKARPERAPAIVPGEPFGGRVQVKREYSPGPVGRSVQKAVEKAKGGPVELSTKRLPVFGSKVTKAVIGGVTKPGRVDLQHNAGRLLSNMKSAHAEEFANREKPTSEAAAEAVPVFHEGYARRPETFIEDARQRLARLRTERKNLTSPTDLKANQAQIDKYAEVLKLSPEEIQAAYTSSKALGEEQHHGLREQVYSGHLEPDQENARYLGFGLEHGHHLGEGPLELQKNPGKHPLVAERGKIRRNILRAEGEVQRRKQDLHRAQGVAIGTKRAVPAGLKAAVKPDPFAQRMLDDAKAHLQELRHEYVGHTERLAEEHALGNTDQQHNLRPGLYTRSGRRVGLGEIKALAHNPDSPAYIGDRHLGFISHKLVKANVERHGALDEGSGVVTRSRTGVHAGTGAYEATYGSITRELRKAARNVAKTQTRNQLLETFGHEVGDRPHMERVVEHLNDRQSEAEKRDLGEWVLTSRGPDRILESPGLSNSRLVAQKGEDHGALVNGADSKFTAVPQRVLERIEKHQTAERPTGMFEKGLKKATGYMRHSALYATPRWPIGVTQENAIRMAAANTSPLVTIKGFEKMSRAYKAGRGVLKGLNEYGDELRHDQANPRVPVPEKVEARNHAAMIEHGSMVGNIAKDFTKGINRDMQDQAPPTWDKPGLRNVVKGWDRWKNFIGKHLTEMENRTRVAAVGHIALKELGTFSKEAQALVRQEDGIVKGFARGKLNPNEATDFTEKLLNIVGNWDHLTPATRELQGTWTPFGLWWLNSAKFMFKTMPVEHPLKTALWTALVASAPPDTRKEFKKGAISIDIPGVGPVDASFLHYSPADIGHEPTKTALSMVAPWALEAYQRASGINPLYQESIYNAEEGEGKGPSNLGAAAVKTGLDLLPFGNTAASFARQGGSPDERAGPLAPFTSLPRSQKGLGKTAAKFLSPVPFTYGKAEPKKVSVKAEPEGTRERPTRERPTRERPSRERAQVGKQHKSVPKGWV